MADLPKKVWSNKKLVFSDKKAVWKLWDKIGVYDPQFKEVDEWETYVDRWEELNWTDEIQIYDTMEPTNIWTMNDGIVATYTFEDYDGTVLKTGTVKDWWTPVAPTDPTRESTAQYSYTFTGREPEVWVISENTIYVAQYSETLRSYTATFKDYDDTELKTETVAYGSDATPPEDPTREWYTFTGRDPSTMTITWDTTFTAQYEEIPVETATFSVSRTTSNPDPERWYSETNEYTCWPDWSTFPELIDGESIPDWAGYLSPWNITVTPLEWNPSITVEFNALDNEWHHATLIYNGMEEIELTYNEEEGVYSAMINGFVYGDEIGIYPWTEDNGYVLAWNISFSVEGVNFGSFAWNVTEGLQPVEPEEPVEEPVE